VRSRAGTTTVGTTEATTVGDVGLVVDGVEVLAIPAAVGRERLTLASSLLVANGFSGKQKTYVGKMMV
jgi:hypothetical protein